MDETAFDVKTATKIMCVIESKRRLDLAVRMATAGKDKMADMAFGLALKAENAAFDGRA